MENKYLLEFDGFFSESKHSIYFTIFQILKVLKMKKTISVLIKSMLFPITSHAEVLLGKISNIVSRGDVTFIQMTEPNNRVIINQETPSNVKDILINPSIIDRDVRLLIERDVDDRTGEEVIKARGVIVR